MHGVLDRDDRLERLEFPDVVLDNEELFLLEPERLELLCEPESADDADVLTEDVERCESELSPALPDRDDPEPLLPVEPVELFPLDELALAGHTGGSFCICSNEHAEQVVPS